jgi:ribosomal protein S18 acetylase RimI-like enzyme
VGAAGAVADLWVALADEQRAHGSHLLTAPNRATIREAIVRHAVADGLLVARTDPERDGEDHGADGEHGSGADAAGGSDDRDAGTRATRGPEDRERRDDPGSSEDAADTEDGLLGFVMFGPETGRYAQDVSRGVVRNLYVRPDCRGEGVGAALLGAAEAALADRGVEVVALESMAGNGAARRFYRRRGYTPHRVELERTLESDND